jgi:hypothetical protein
LGLRFFAFRVLAVFSEVKLLYFDTEYMSRLPLPLPPPGACSASLPFGDELRRVRRMGCGHHTAFVQALCRAHVAVMWQVVRHKEEARRVDRV